MIVINVEGKIPVHNVLRFRCIRPGRAQTQIPFIHHTGISCMAFSRLKGDMWENRKFWN
jgi:hypothetical protein